MPNALSRRIHRCPVTAFQKMISGKYKLRILWDLQDGPLRYGEIRSGAAARRRRFAADCAARAEPRAQGAGTERADRAQGLRRRAAQGRISADPNRPQLHPGGRRNPQVGSAASWRRTLERGELTQPPAQAAPRRSSFIAFSLRMSGRTSGLMSSVSKSRSQRSGLITGQSEPNSILCRSSEFA